MRVKKEYLLMSLSYSSFQLRAWELPHSLPVHQNKVCIHFLLCSILDSQSVPSPSFSAFTLFHMAECQWWADHFYSIITAPIIKLWQRNTGLFGERNALLFPCSLIFLKPGCYRKHSTPQRTYHFKNCEMKKKNWRSSVEGDLRSFSIMARQIKMLVLSDGGRLSGCTHRIRLAEHTYEVNAY